MVEHAVCVIDREGGGADVAEAEGIDLHALFTMRELEVLRRTERRRRMPRLTFQQRLSESSRSPLGWRAMQTPGELTELFRAHGRKITAQRQCIFRALEGDVTHPSAERVHERVRHDMPNVSLRTVYQTLNDLADLGAITVLDVGTGSARFDPNVETTHHHLVCRSCGKVRDVAADFPGSGCPGGRRRASKWTAPRSSFAASATSAGDLSRTSR